MEPQVLLPRVYNHDSSTWVAAGHETQALGRGCVLKVVSWNLECFGPDPAARASAALVYLEHTFGKAPTDLVVMLQEICPESLQAILEHAWVQRNFTLSNIDAPAPVIVDIPGPSFTMRETLWEGDRYFTLMMVSKTLPMSKCFRLPFTTKMGRDALVVDIAISNFNESFRLCTTHLESLWIGKPYRLGQLTSISALLKGKSVPNGKIIGGMVGGDMNAFTQPEHGNHKIPEVDLNDVWEDEPAPLLPVLKAFQKDTSYGRARGNTYGYQSPKRRNRQRLDKFFYTGSVETFAADEAQDVAGRFGRLGIGLKTEIKAWVRPGSGEEHLLSERAALKLKNGPSLLTPITKESWVSDHFGVVVGVRIL
ncbi:Endonuclease/exonuclease/phosphatase [Nemania serpens]|nr:Endonuclease/exonuclease/phosphatase [Nemania serpens]